MASVRDTLTVRSGDVRLAVYLSGPRNAPPVILVHGYPDSARVWERVREHLDKRFRVIAYDVRGAGASDAPKRRADYKLPVLARDLLAVADATCGNRPFHLVGHDWGSIQCWEAATDPSIAGRLASYTSISGPCLDHVFRAPLNLKQTLKSWYVAFFHLPLVPELAWRLGGAKLWPLWLRKTERIVVDADPDQLRNGLNGLKLYRANFIERARRPRERYAQAPVQIIVPRYDRYVTPALTRNLDRWLGAHRRDEIAASHWTVIRDAALIAARIGRFAAAHEPRRQAIAAGAKSGGQQRTRQRANQHASGGKRLKSVS
ncbi:alpha/beta fold hydrolase [Burkholderia oklahomensis]|uniref:Alpha/beta hydrolase fold family protein n=1 Tax=Burkholderia oklahomensis TaxID=342113 RepID=A0AAI8BBU1_9BURK|nr:alpha/beta fold hydrolase [Burkholderia oklahomensis]AIO69179.1 alpha/beta hydrolase fold family protein [Burkholderia oklahomensis]AOI39465.1 alpha/beta hydrolase [Burkholderia oklahomensis EO147]KUY50378.1 alpha/beta hydrolase [Burkholderia oklahomensis EO147]QPS40186.1 alpha/beta fold hydrolase [Burkholderia oklahomensis]